MEFLNEVWTIQRLVEVFENGKLDLQPPYQRSDIWTARTKSHLIDSIQLNFPLPTFFLQAKQNDAFDVVDGQQRTRAILGYQKGVIRDDKGKFINALSDEERENFMQYSLTIVLITKVFAGERIEEFFYRVNKFGDFVNRPETLKALYIGTPFQKLIEEISESDSFSSLQLFKPAARRRIIDQDFVAELLVLVRDGITDKKLQVDNVYESSLGDDEVNELRQYFFKLLDYCVRFDKFKRLASTRYSQKNDFYSLFSFLREHNNLSVALLDYCYVLLTLIEPDIRPSNEDCEPFFEYALNCVSQSNSKNARLARLKFFEEFLLNCVPNPHDRSNTENAQKDEESKGKTICQILDYYHLKDDALVNIEGYLPIDEKQLRSAIELKQVNVLR